MDQFDSYRIYKNIGDSRLSEALRDSRLNSRLRNIFVKILQVYIRAYSLSYNAPKSTRKKSWFFRNLISYTWAPILLFTKADELIATGWNWHYSFFQAFFQHYINLEMQYRAEHSLSIQWMSNTCVGKML